MESGIEPSNKSEVEASQVGRLHVPPSGRARVHPLQVSILLKETKLYIIYSLLASEPLFCVATSLT